MAELTVLSTTQALLKALSVLDTPEAQAALVLARALDANSGSEIALKSYAAGRAQDAVAPMVKQLELTLDKIRASAPKVADAVDDVLAKARSRKTGRAGTTGVVRTTQRGKRSG